jgi:CheY-specific phosphatase CheX
MTAMKTSISEVMETMFYLPVEFSVESAFGQSGMDECRPNMACRLKFSGDVSGYFMLVVPKSLLSEATENFMGKSQKDLGEEHLLGTLTEILNMACGNALKKTGSKIPFELDIPEVMDASQILPAQLFTMIETPQSMMAIALVMD